MRDGGLAPLLYKPEADTPLKPPRRTVGGAVRNRCTTHYLYSGPNAAQATNAGSALSLTKDGTRLAVGMYDATRFGQNFLQEAGSVSVFVHGQGGWQEEQALWASDAQEFGRFGLTVETLLPLGFDEASRELDRALDALEREPRARERDRPPLVLAR